MATARPTSKAVQPSRSAPAASVAARTGGFPKTKYFSIVPLHLAFSIFAIYYLPSKYLNARPDQDHGGFVDSLVRCPYQSLFVMNVGLVSVQIWFSSYLRSWRKASLNTTTASKQPSKTHPKLDLHKVWSDFGARKVDPRVSTALLELALLLQETVLITFLATFAIHVLMVLLGAGLVRDGGKTFLLATMLSILAIFPPAFVIGWNQSREKQTWIRLFSSLQPKNELELALLCPAFGACLGCWLGAFPIPLDWDRPWQTWPITCVVGTSIGHACGTITAMILCALGAPFCTTQKK
ncbi:hypothetical protein O181_027379 [Austropuccinia psidii MF-1]|uniref:Glycosylphosphatidylinositol anchor biosynthesis protein 11 n=1 Tax=Austropuccinia psidii MF-1 TaxID=1389203 RepID=A0A9Q3CLX0_9BASI|nr:hypothetical protein [Austropuccinia psidii MF-1]